ncbi:PAS domain S-box protein [Pseudoduganella eburnea]|uniref:histidine kinase n=1 Tax=Massilia eburnea TaxID=1776165 RepID=A0A6L6QPB0_9BURK|nr:sensor histidine kinase [Massilia eburnea]MTW13343.1 PAS domain S-box protein [Massilia eburnea]
MKPVRYKAALGTYLALAFCALAMLMGAILAAIIGHTAGDQVKADIGNALSDLALQASDKLDRNMFERYRELQLLAQRPDMGAAAPPAARRATLETHQRSYPHYAWLGVTGEDGHVLAATGTLLEGHDVSERPWYRNAKAGTFVGDVHDAALLAKLLPASGPDAARFIDLAFPLADDSGVLGAHLSWQWARELERSVMEPVSIHREVQAIIVDRAGKVLLGPPELEAKTLPLQGRHAGYRVERWSDGVDYLVGYARTRGHAAYPGLGWAVLVRQRVDTAWTPVHELQERAWWMGVAMAALFSLLAFPLSRRIARPLRQLADAADRIRQGEAAALPQLAPYAEVQALSRTLISLVANLEGRVSARTRQLREAMQRIGAIIDSAQDAFIAADPDGRISDWNPAAERMFGWTRAEAVGKSYIALMVPQRFRAQQEAALAAARGSDAASFGRRVQLALIRRDGAELVVEASVSRPADALFTAFLHDISEQRKVEEMKNEFIATVSHELRTPMTSIRGSLSMLIEGAAGELPPDVRHLVNIAYQSSERLVRLVNNILDIEKIEAGKMDFRSEELTVAPLLEEAFNAVRGSAAERPVALERQGDGRGMKVRGDRDKLVQVLVNLLSNAIKYSPQFNTVTLACAATPEGIRMSVSDNGAGIPQEFQARVFEKFGQADSSDTRIKGGTGLGLAICRAIVEQHGGSIGFETREGQGTTFHVVLPAVS